MDEFASPKDKYNTYKVWGGPPFASDVAGVQTFLFAVPEVQTASIKTYGIINECVKFKFKGTEQMFKDFLSVLTSRKEYRVVKTKKCLF